MKWSAYLSGEVWYPFKAKAGVAVAEVYKRLLMVNGLKPLTRKERAELKRKDVRW